MKSCFANNPAAPYIFPIMPTWPGEYMDPGLQNAFGATGRGYSATYRFDRREAIVDLRRDASTGPGTSGIQTYLATRKGNFDTSQPTYQFFATKSPEFLGVLFATVPRDPSRIQSLSSLGNSTNNVVIKRQSGRLVRRLRAFVISTRPDDERRSPKATRTALGFPARTSSRSPVPSKGSRVGPQAGPPMTS